jgi:hypothetical protein
MRRPLHALPLLLALVAGAIAAPTSTATATAASMADESTGTISGTVTYPGGDVTNIAVYLRHPQERSAFTSTRPDDQGRWSITVPAGTYRVHFGGDKYVVRQDWGGANPADVVVAPGAAVTDVDASLVRGGNIAAMSTASAGAFQLRLFQKDGDLWVPTPHGSLLDGAPWWTSFQGLEPGTYRLQVESLPGGNAWGERNAGVTPLPTIQQEDLVVTPGSTLTPRVAAPASSNLVQPVQRPSVSEPGRAGTFELRPGSWPSGTSVVEQQWYSGPDVMGPLAGATGRTFSAGAQHHGHHVAVRTVVRRAGHPDTVHWSATQRVMEPVERDVQITLGRTSADVETSARISGDWMSGTYVVYHWFVDGTLMSSSSNGAFRPPRSSVGKTLRVRVTQDFEGRRLAAETAVVVGETTRRLVARPRIQNARVEDYPSVTDVWKTWSPAPDVYYDTPDFRFRTEWFLDGRPIATPRRLSWRFGGHRLHARVTLSQTGYRTATINTPPVTVQLGRIYSAARPDLNALMVSAGGTLRASKGSWSVRPTSVRYRWYADKKPIKGATSSRLKVTKKMAGKRLRLRVTASHPGYRSATRWSSTLRVNPWYPGKS